MAITNKTTITRRTLLAGASGTLIASRAWAQQPSEVKVGLLVPISGLYARPGTVMREGAEMAVDHILVDFDLTGLDQCILYAAFEEHVAVAGTLGLDFIADGSALRG